MADLSAKPSPAPSPSPAPPASDGAAEERFWRGGIGGAGGADTGAVPPEPGTTPADLTDEPEVEPGFP